jgi:hypothetical protein
VKDASQLFTPPDSRGVVGHVVDLACVAGEKEARLLSWAAGARASEGSSSRSGSSSGSGSSSRRKVAGGGGGGGGYMKALVFTSNKYAKLVQRETACFSLDRMVSVRGQLEEEEEGGGAGEEEEYSTQLALPQYLSSKGQRIPGNPRHMVNLLEMVPGKNDLRGTVFHVIFRDKLVMDSSRDAERFLKQLRAEGRDTPTVYTLKEGECVRGDGFTSPEDTLPVNLDFVFGEPRAEDVDVLEAVEAGRWEGGDGVELSLWQRLF